MLGCENMDKKEVLMKKRDLGNITIEELDELITLQEFNFNRVKQYKMNIVQPYTYKESKLTDKIQGKTAISQKYKEVSEIPVNFLKVGIQQFVGFSKRVGEISTNTKLNIKSKIFNK